ncbi:MAG: chloride channel protein [Actinomycetota bacterium]|jgi:H+/Cl- antiporter ClcA|nr:chloride channel protein [Actinomycetota bacterium]
MDAGSWPSAGSSVTGADAAGGDPAPTAGEEQANLAVHLADLSARFWILLVLTGIGAGLGAMTMMAILRAVQHAAFGYRTGNYSAAAARSSDLRIVVVLAVGGLVTGVGLWLMRRSGGLGGEPTHVVWTGSGALSLIRTLLSGALSEVTVGMGASLGREGAPQHTGAACGDALGRRFGLSDEQRMLLIACGAGAGLAAVYNVPLAGALFALEIYLGTVSIGLVLPALLAAGIATAVSWITLPNHAVYSVPHVPNPTVAVMIFAVVAGPVIGVTATGYLRAVAWARSHQPRGRLLLVEPLVVFALLGALAIKYPLLLGNGIDLAQFAFVGSAGVLMFLALAVLKPISTTACLRSGAYGGLFTPTLSFGAALGALGGHLWSMAWPGAPDASYVAIAAAAMLAGALKAPITGTAFLLELTRSTSGIMAPIVIAVVGASLVARHLDQRSLYTARGSATARATPDMGPGAGSR